MNKLKNAQPYDELDIIIRNVSPQIERIIKNIDCQFIEILLLDYTGELLIRKKSYIKNEKLENIKESIDNKETRNKHVKGSFADKILSLPKEDIGLKNVILEQSYIENIERLEPHIILGKMCPDDFTVYERVEPSITSNGLIGLNRVDDIRKLIIERHNDIIEGPSWKHLIAYEIAYYDIIARDENHNKILKNMLLHPILSHNGHVGVLRFMNKINKNGVIYEFEKRDEKK